jgi:hypothetical protein
VRRRAHTHGAAGAGAGTGVQPPAPTHTHTVQHHSSTANTRAGWARPESWSEQQRSTHVCRPRHLAAARQAAALSRSETSGLQHSPFAGRRVRNTGQSDDKSNAPPISSAGAGPCSSSTGSSAPQRCSRRPRAAARSRPWGEEVRQAGQRSRAPPVQRATPERAARCAHHARCAAPPVQRRR